MTTITLEVPDELAVRLDTRRNQLPQLLSMALDLLPLEKPFVGPTSEMVYPVFKEMIDFFIDAPTPAQIVRFKISPSVQARLEELLDQKRENSLTDDEIAELEVYRQINHVLILLKARAHLALSSAN